MSCSNDYSAVNKRKTENTQWTQKSGNRVKFTYENVPIFKEKRFSLKRCFSLFEDTRKQIKITELARRVQQNLVLE